jgi:hypothetical protein
MTDEEHKWIETNNSVCALLRQAHDVLAMSSFPPRRTWVGLTADEQSFVFDQVKQIVDSKPFWVRFADAIEAKIKEKNT